MGYFEAQVENKGGLRLKAEFGGWFGDWRRMWSGLVGAAAISEGVTRNATEVRLSQMGYDLWSELDTCRHSLARRVRLAPLLKDNGTWHRTTDGREREYRRAAGLARQIEKTKGLTVDERRYGVMLGVGQAVRVGLVENKLYENLDRRGFDTGAARAALFLKNLGGLWVHEKRGLSVVAVSAVAALGVEAYAANMLGLTQEAVLLAVAAPVAWAISAGINFWRGLNGGKRLDVVEAIVDQVYQSPINTREDNLRQKLLEVAMTQNQAEKIENSRHNAKKRQTLTSLWQALPQLDFLPISDLAVPGSDERVRMYVNALKKLGVVVTTKLFKPFSPKEQGIMQTLVTHKAAQVLKGWVEADVLDETATILNQPYDYAGAYFPGMTGEQARGCQIAFKKAMEEVIRASYPKIKGEDAYTFGSKLKIELRDGGIRLKKV